MNRLLRVLVCSAILLLGACSSSPSRMNPRDIALTNYGVAIRWSEFEKALDFVAPAVRAQAPLTALESERFKQIQVTGYDVKTRTLQPDGGILQTVEIRLISKHTQLERTVIDHQAWTWDPEAKVYWLSSGLPDFNAP